MLKHFWNLLQRMGTTRTLLRYQGEMCKSGGKKEKGG
jgi:hypothetical protein